MFEQILIKFEGETGLKLIYDVFDSNQVSELKMLPVDPFTT